MFLLCSIVLKFVFLRFVLFVVVDFCFRGLLLEI